jgi:hypothetical protein
MMDEPTAMNAAVGLRRERVRTSPKLNESG